MLVRQLAGLAAASGEIRSGIAGGKLSLSGLPEGAADPGGGSLNGHAFDAPRTSSSRACSDAVTWWSARAARSIILISIRAASKVLRIFLGQSGRAEVPASK
jgi:hypothetical protein